MKKYTSLNNFFNDIIDKKLRKILKKDNDLNETNYLCDIDYMYKNIYNKCNIVSQVNNDNLLGNKWTQYKNFCEYCKKINKEVPYYIPKTYLINKTKMNKDELEDIFKNKKKWIVKPENASFRAGIHVVNNYKDMMDWINQYINTKWIVQDYIDNPLKIEDKKMHLRIYVLLIRTKDYAQVFIFNKGYIFLSTKKYDINSLDDESNLSGGDSKEQMRLYPNKLIKDYGIDVYKKILNQINTIVKDTMEATIDQLSCTNIDVHNYKCYKFLGYDILVTDESNDHKLYLAEVNSRTVNVKFPIKNMYEDILSIVLDKSNKPLSNSYLRENNINFYSVIKKVYNKDILN
tara:strand:- start:533 stop:1570 length:1038 start_codon:yes stop_codon:yes gene_type:complete